MRRLLPDPAETSPAEQFADLELPKLAHEKRPWVVLNFAHTVDGRASIEGRSGKIGSDTDSEVLHLLRTQVDAVMIGAGTMRAERYGRMVPEADLRGHREEIGLAADPLAVIISGRLDLPWDASLFTDGNGEVVIFTASEDEPPETETPVDCVRMDGGVEPDAVLEDLRGRGIRALLCEGGPHLHAQLWAGGVADELFLTTAPKLSGGDAPSILEGELPDIRMVELVWLLELEGELYARYRRSD